MVEGDGTIYNDFKERLMLGGHNLGAAGDTLKMMLVHTYTPNIDTHQVKADVTTEYGTAGGYTAGGATLGSKTVTQDDANDRAAFDAADVVWTSLTLTTPATPSDCVLYNDTPTSPADPLIAYWELGTTVTNGGDYTLQFSTTPSALILLT